MDQYSKILIIIYLILALLMGYRVFKNIKASRLVGDNADSFKKRTSKFEYLMLGILLVFAILNTFNGLKNKDKMSLIFSVIIVFISIMFLATLFDKFYIFPEGIVANGQVVSFKELKKWGFDTENGNLVLIIKKNHEEQTITVQSRKEDIEKINKLIRKYKLGKE
ncbi:MAG: DUF5673 domain-containing protein [Peptoniphilaceae bacterium]|nr:DUF5673 domain-containing protein [Peptoniphilaceae bacterium]MDD7383343.1 DUF5673 domain-containing protein [Peptoniphilaceae bacterium]MDY3738286.1 DUF5673 domain-containing protein [Peptoniphilaceae bacterium]